jgi:hypothetical protein
MEINFEGVHQYAFYDFSVLIKCCIKVSQRTVVKVFTFVMV